MIIFMKLVSIPGEFSHKPQVFIFSNLLPDKYRCLYHVQVFIEIAYGIYPA